jgi:hypothetical protein
MSVVGKMLIMIRAMQLRKRMRAGLRRQREIGPNLVKDISSGKSVAVSKFWEAEPADHNVKNSPTNKDRV